MFSEKRLVSFQAAEQWPGEEPNFEGSPHLAYTVFDGVYPTKCLTLSDARSDANIRLGNGTSCQAECFLSEVIDSYVQQFSPDTPVNQNVVIIQGNTKTAIVEVLKGEFTPAIERFVEHRYAEYVLGTIDRTVSSPYMHEDHILFQENLQVIKLTSLHSEIQDSLCAEYYDASIQCQPFIVFNMCIDGRTRFFHVIYDSHDTEHYILLDDNCEEIEKFSTPTELEDILIQQKNTL